MGEVKPRTKEQIAEEAAEERRELVAALIESSPKARLDDVNIYVDAFLEYRQAQENITRNGSIVAHPRSGAPMPNPYLAVKASSLRIMSVAGKRLKVAPLWK